MELRELERGWTNKVHALVGIWYSFVPARAIAVKVESKVLSMNPIRVALLNEAESVWPFLDEVESNP